MFKKPRVLVIAVCLLELHFAWSSHAAAETSKHDIVIYGGTSAGIVAGIQALEMGKSVIVVEPTNREGGLTTGGLGQTDIGNKQVIGGLSREFYQRISKYYSEDSAWKWQKRTEYRDSGQSRTADGERAMWTFEPSAALSVYRDWIGEKQLPIVQGERLDRTNGITKSETKIVAIQMESGRRFEGKVFIDATYEGDLLAAAGVSFTVGREANSQYQETLNGVQTKRAKYHNFVDRVDPFRVAGSPSSGLLPFIDTSGPGTEGQGDHRVQAYCYRMCLTDHPENQIRFHKPQGYDPSWYELLLRNFEAGESGMPWINSGMPNRKTDTNNRTGFSTDFIGQNYDYPEASYDERERIAAKHLLYQQGLMWTLANDARVPQKIRREVARWGMCKDEFVEGDGWQKQLYVREARRMVGELVMSQNHCQQKQSVSDSIGMGAYTMDSHHVQRHLTSEGYVSNEGDVQVGGFPPYPISYRSITPQRSEASNLLVPVCLSASHIAFGSIRMEPVFMVLGQSSATAASLAIDGSVAVQDVPYPKLRDRLLKDGQILEHTAPIPKSNLTSLESLNGTVIDDTGAQLSGNWSEGGIRSGVHMGYLHDDDARDGTAQATFEVQLSRSGRYQVQVAYLSHANRATNVPVEVAHAAGTTKKTINQRKSPEIAGRFTSVGEFEFDSSGTVTITNRGTDGYVVVDAVRWLPLP